VKVSNTPRGGGSAKRVLEPIFETKFCERSYGFRPKRSAHMALETIRKDLREGYLFVIDADLALFRYDPS
jgi:RNA-directed DNA polymerase